MIIPSSGAGGIGISTLCYSYVDLFVYKTNSYVIFNDKLKTVLNTYVRKFSPTNSPTKLVMNVYFPNFKLQFK
jgi:hypothetical protein